MGLWKQHFHWSVLLDWVVLAVTVPAILCIAGLLLVFDQFRGANVCFVITALLIFGKIVNVAVISQDSVPQRLLFTFVLFGVFGVAIVETVRGVNHWKDRKKETETSKPKESNTLTQGPPQTAGPFDSAPAEWRRANRPDDLTLHDFFLLDFQSVQQKQYGAVFVDDSKTISVQYAINVELTARSKFLSFYIERQDGHTAAICEYLGRQYQFILDRAPQLLIEQKNPGDSGTISTKEAVFSKRIYIYHETYLPPEETVKLTDVYAKNGLSGIFRSTDYLSTKKTEAMLLKLRKEQTPR